MKAKHANTAVGRHDSFGSRREQALCVDAVASGNFDTMTDTEWVAMCERVAREERFAPDDSALGESRHASLVPNEAPLPS